MVLGYTHALAPANVIFIIGKVVFLNFEPIALVTQKNSHEPT